jgi:PAS domain S-box-containing protein
MKDQDRTIEKLVTIEKAINEMLELRKQVVELKESETQRQLSTEALRASEKEYKVLVENIPQKLFIKDQNSVYVFCNAKYAEDLKIKPDEICGKTDYDFFPKELAEKYIADDKRIMETGKLENIEEKYVREGQTFIIHTVKTPIKGEKEDIVGILGIFWDITGQKRNEEEMKKYRVHLEELVSDRTAELQTVNKQLQLEISERRRVEEQLQQVEEKYRTIVENTGTATVIIEEDMVISLANREFEKLSGYSKEAIEGKKSWTEFGAKDDLEKMKEYFLARRTTPDAVPKHFECRFIGKEGNPRDILMTTAIIPETKKIVASLFDITSRKQMEESLRTLEERYQALVTNANEAIIVVQDGMLKFVNPKIFEILGYSEDELTSRPFEEFIHPEDREVFEAHIRRLERGEFPHVYPFRIIHRDGDMRWLENRIALIHWDGRPAVLNFMIDITDRKQAEEELRNSIEPFRALVNAMEKILFTLNRD